MKVISYINLCIKPSCKKRYLIVKTLVITNIKYCFIPLKTSFR
nr:MAG TPA: hypothetical protein [Caudoviricetes sp.]